MLTPSLSLPRCFFYYFFMQVCVHCECPVQKRGSRQGSGITQRTLLFMTEELMRSVSPSLSALGSLPPFFAAQIGLGGGEGLSWQRCEKDMPGYAPVVSAIY